VDSCDTTADRGDDRRVRLRYKWGCLQLVHTTLCNILRRQSQVHHVRRGGNIKLGCYEGSICLHQPRHRARVIQRLANGKS